MSEYIIPVAKLGARVLVAKEKDISKIGTDRSLEVFVEQWDLAKGVFESEERLEVLLKFNPWKDIGDEIEKETILRNIERFRIQKEFQESTAPKFH